MTIYTLGYSEWKIEDVEALLDRLDAVLVDVRMVPWSRLAPIWNGAALHERLGDRYVWLREFGNRNYKGTFEQIEIADFPEGEKRLRELIGAGSITGKSGRKVILLCGCPDVNTCHRKFLAERLAQMWKEKIVHMTHPDNGVNSNHPMLFY